MSKTRQRSKQGASRREAKRRLMAQDLIEYARSHRIRLEDVSKHAFYTEKHANAYDGCHRKGLFQGWQEFKEFALAARQHSKPEPKVGKAHTYVITWAQNATPVFEPGLRALENYCARNEAQLVVVAGRYKNPTSRGESKKQDSDHWWDERLSPYLFQGEVKLHDTMKLYGNAFVQPTAANPTNGLEVVCGHNSAIVGHPRVAFRTVASAFGLPRLLYSTGAITLPSYSESAAGFKARQHHSLGALVVEIDDDPELVEPLYHCRHVLMCGDGGFIDLDTEYFPHNERTVTAKAVVPNDISCWAPSKPAQSLVTGDTHVAQGEGVHDVVLWNEDSLFNTIKPKATVVHDVLDFLVGNHHSRHSIFHKLDTRHTTVEEECEETAEFLIRLREKGTEVYVIASNHDEAFDRWLNEVDPKQDPANALFYHRMWVAVLSEHINGNSEPPAFETFCKEYFEKTLTHTGDIHFVPRNGKLMFGDICVHFHGDVGVNGSRGSAQQWRKLSHKTITGHTHSPFILDGAYGVGVTAKLHQGYNERGPSSWLQNCVAVLANGKRQSYNIIEGRFRRKR